MAGLTEYEQKITGLILGLVDPKHVKAADAANAAHACEEASLEKEFPDSFKHRRPETPTHQLPGLPKDKAEKLKELQDKKAESFNALYGAIEKSARDIGMAGKRDPDGSNTPFETLATTQVTQNLTAEACVLKSKPIQGVGPARDANAAPKRGMNPSA